MISSEVLKSLCAPGRASTEDPFSFEFDGSWWDAATNGHAIIAVRQGNGELTREWSPPAHQLFKSGKATHFARFALFVKWLNNCEKESVCKDCDGTGSHVCNCRYCEVLDGSACPECEGDKVFTNRIEVNFGRWHFDRVLAARYLLPFVAHDGEVEVSFGDALDPFEFRAANWRVLIMPMRASDDDKSTGSVPEGLLVPL